MRNSRLTWIPLHGANRVLSLLYFSVSMSPLPFWFSFQSLFSKHPWSDIFPSRLCGPTGTPSIEPFDAMCLGSRISQLFVVSSGCVSFRSFVYFKEIIPVVSEGEKNKLRIKFSHPLQLVKRPRLSCDVMRWFERSGQGLKGG